MFVCCIQRHSQTQTQTHKHTQTHTNTHKHTQTKKKHTHTQTPRHPRAFSLSHTLDKPLMDQSSNGSLMGQVERVGQMDQSTRVEQVPWLGSGEVRNEICLGNMISGNVVDRWSPAL